LEYAENWAGLFVHVGHIVPHLRRGSVFSKGFAP
jgi:hypothetical protein